MLLFVQGLFVSLPHNLQSMDLMTQIVHVLNAFQGKLHKRGICSIHILLCNRYSIAYFVSLVILILFPWNEKVPVSGVVDWLFVCFTSNHQPKPKALKVPNEGNERRSRSQPLNKTKVCMGGGRRLILLGSYIMRLSGVKANEWPLFIWAKPCGSPEDSLQAGLLVFFFYP